MSETLNLEERSYELLQTYGESIQNYLKDWVDGKDVPPPSYLSGKGDNKDEIEKIIDQQQSVIINSLQYDEERNSFSFNVGRVGITIQGEAADLIKQGYKNKQEL